MSGPTMMVHLALERLSRRELARVPEAEMAMNDTVLNAAFRDAGRDDGVLAFLYLFHALRISAVILPGDRVLDLACGPANQLGLVARLNPESNFAGVDASPGMLAEARDTLARVGVENVSLLPGDMTNLVGIADASVDCVVSTMSLHHLPDPDALKKAMLEARRVLKPGGGVYIVDFGRLKRHSTQQYFAQDWRKEQSAEFTQEYLHSLQAAFSVEELTSAALALGAGIERFTTPLAPFMVVFSSPARRAWSENTQREMRAHYQELDARQQEKFDVFARWMAAGGCHLPFALK